MPVEFGPIASQFRERSSQSSVKTSEQLLSDETFNAPSERSRASVGRIYYLFVVVNTLLALTMSVIHSTAERDWMLYASVRISAHLFTNSNFSMKTIASFGILALEGYDVLMYQDN